MGDGIVNGYLDVRILGPLEVRRGAQPLPLGGPRQQAVLACLVVANASLTTEQLAGAIWGETAPPGYLSTLQTYVFHLRETLEPHRVKGAPAEVLVTTPRGYALSLRDEDVDARRFEHLVDEGRSLVVTDPRRASGVLRDALALWRGDTLADLADIELVSQEASRLDELRQSALESWADAELVLGHHAALAPELGRLVAAYPLREGLHAQRMLALYRDGRQAEALAAYRQLRTTLDEELGVDPGRPVQVLHEQMLRHDPELDWRPVGTIVSPPMSEAPRAGDEPAVTSDPAAPPPVVAHRSRRRRWTARAAVALTVLGLLTWTVVKATTWDDVTPVPPNTLAMLSDHGLDGDPLPMTPSPGALAGGNGTLWVADEGNDDILRVDPADHRVVQTITGVGGSPRGLAVTQGDVWVAGSREGVVARLNTASNRVVDKITVGVQPAAIVASAEAVWVANSADNTVQRIDPATDKVGDPIRVGDGPEGLLLDGGTLWVANSRSGSVTRLDTRTGERAAADIRVDVGARGMTITDTDVWVANELGQSVSRIDRTSGRVVTIPVEDGPSTVVVSGGFAWVNNAYSGTVSRIDLETNRVSRIDLKSAPRALALVDDRVWVVTGAFGSVEHQGGTLVYAEYRNDSGTLDPARVGAPARIATLRHVYDGLVSFRVTGGRGAEALVPNLATRLPTPSDGGLTYTFTVRAGIRYSTGAEVKASDFVHGLRRALAGAGGDSPFIDVVGALPCTTEPTVPGNCDLRGGADADDAARRVTIRLTKPDPDFLFKLTLNVVPTPAGTPLDDLGLKAEIPGTGPYLISAVQPNGSFMLSRNPYFAPWSFAAQPAAYPDHIESRVVTSRDQMAADVIAGSIDVAPITVAEAGKLSAHAELIHEFENNNTDWAYLNAKIPPFDNRKARQALNYAVDRRTFVSLYGGNQGSADISCQLLPRGFSSWRPYCPYQTGPATGPYQGPDVARARELVRESGTAGVPITVHAYHGYPLWDAFPAYVADVLRSIGYANVTVVDIPLEHDTDPTDPAYAGYQIFTQQGWLADYPSASNFYELFSCHRPNFSSYCNPEIEAVAVDAAKTAQTDPTHSLELWAQVDRMLTDDAAFVTLGSHHDASLVSERVQNVMTRSGLGAVLSQLWVQ